MIATVTDMKAFLPSIVMKDSPDVFDDALLVSQEALENDILGKDLMTAIDTEHPTSPDLKKKCQRIVCVWLTLRPVCRPGWMSHVIS